MSFGYAPAPAQLNLKTGEAGWIVCEQSALPIRYGSAILNEPRFPMWEYARFTGQGDIGSRLLFNVPTGCRIDIQPETEFDRQVYNIARGLAPNQTNIVQALNTLQQSIVSYGERKKNLQTIDRDSTIPEDTKQKYYEYLQKELVSISEELPLIKSLAQKCSDYLTDRSAEIESAWKKVDAKIVKAERHAKKKQDREENRNEFWRTMNTVGGIALSAIPYVGSIISAVATTAVSLVNAKYNSDQFNKIGRTLGQAYDKILMEEQPEALNQLDEAVRKDSSTADVIIAEAEFFTEAKAVESRLLLVKEKLKTKIWDTEDLLASLRAPAQTPIRTETATPAAPPWLKWAAVGGAALILYYLL